jgi:hypothetical protein
MEPVLETVVLLPLGDLDFGVKDVLQVLESWNESDFDFVVTLKLSTFYRNYVKLKDRDCGVNRRLQLGDSV